MVFKLIISINDCGEIKNSKTKSLMETRVVAIL